MSAASIDLARTSFAVRRGEALQRADVSFNFYSRRFRQLLSQARYEAVSIAEIETFIQYGTSVRSTSEPIGVPVIRMNNLQADGLDISDLKYSPLEAGDVSKWALENGDILVNRTNSKELVGKCAVFNLSGFWIFASYLLRLRLDTERAHPQYVADFLSSPAGRVQIDRISRQIAGMTNISVAELRSLKVLLPPLPLQQEMAAKLEAARAEKRALRIQANGLVSDLDSLIFGRLGIRSTGRKNAKRGFAVRLADLLHGRIDALAHSPGLEVANRSSVPVVQLSDIASVNARPPARLVGLAGDLVPYVGLPNCSLTEVREVEQRPLSEVRGRSVAMLGDILFARIEPSVFNRKYVFVDSLGGHNSAYVSGEFYVVRANGTPADQRYLFAILHSDYVAAQVEGQTTGSSGRRRLDVGVFKSIMIPWPAELVRAQLAHEVEDRWSRARLLLSKADDILRDAQHEFNVGLFGPSKANIENWSDD